MTNDHATPQDDERHLADAVALASADVADGGGFDDRAFHELFAVDRSTWPTRVEALALDHRSQPFDAWLARTDRVPY